MAGVTVHVNADIINWILHTIQFDTVASPVIELLTKWQSGEKTPTFNQVEDVSKKTNIPFGYFFLDKPPVEECPIVDYRTVNSVSIPEPSRNLIETLDSMTDIQEWMRNYVIENGQEELEYVGKLAGNINLAIAVKEIRKTLGIEKEWYLNCANATDSFRYIKRTMADIGIIVMMNGIVGNNTRRKLNVDEFRAFTLVDKYAPLIFINTCDTDNGKLFSLVHELAHVWRGVDSFYNSQMSMDVEENEEKICNAIAAELLAPEDVFTKQWENATGGEFEIIEALAKYFKCSRFVIARRALDLKRINRSVYTKIISVLNEQYRDIKNAQGQNKNPGGNFYRTLNSRLDHRVVVAMANSAREGRTQYTDVYRLTNTNRKTFGKLLADIGGSGW
ncbi:MAG: ImmA/IrrE family metallo-endopeptidase [Lachnospiraceae bacterium]|nr:ImmA/IrrE family metallo-endopeptidase [Lachnospiraceae bacterium]